MQDEHWVGVPGFEDLYEVSDQGHIRRLVGRNRNGYYPRVTILKVSSINGQGYPTIKLWRDGHYTQRMLHRIVATAFLGPRPQGMEIRHLDDNKSNWSLANLVYGTRAQNRRDMVLNGIHNQAAKTHCPQGHEYTTENTYSPPSRPNARYCRACNATRSVARRERK